MNAVVWRADVWRYVTSNWRLWTAALIHRQLGAAYRTNPNSSKEQ